MAVFEHSHKRTFEVCKIDSEPEYMSKYCCSVGNPSSLFKHLLLRQGNIALKPLNRHTLGCQF